MGRRPRPCANANPALPSAKNDLRCMIFLQCQFVHLNAKARPGWNLQETVARRLQTAGDDRSAHFTVFRIAWQRYVLDEEIRDAGGKVDRGGSSYGSAIVVGSDRHIIRFRQYGNAPRAANSPLCDIRPHYIDESFA